MLEVVWCLKSLIQTKRNNVCEFSLGFGDSSCARKLTNIVILTVTTPIRYKIYVAKMLGIEPRTSRTVQSIRYKNALDRTSDLSYRPIYPLHFARFEVIFAIIRPHLAARYHRDCAKIVDRICV